MAGSVNKVILIGRLGRDPEPRTTNSGGEVVHLSVATSETWRDKQSGERRERTEWHRVVIFNEHIAKVAREYLTKGALVHIEGQLQTRKWTDQQGIEKYTTEIVLSQYRGELNMLGGRSDGEGEGGGERRQQSPGRGDYTGTRPTDNRGRSSGPAPQSSWGGGGFGGGGTMENDEIPF